MSSVGSKEHDPRHTALTSACASGKEAVVRRILSESSWKHPRDFDALRHGLQRVAARGNVGLIRLLLEHGAEVETRKDSTEVAAVFRAAENGHVAATSLLLNWKASPRERAQSLVSATTASTPRTEARDKWGRTALFPASQRGYVEVVKVLLAAGADVNARDKDDRTVLVHLAAERLFKADGNEEIVHLLLDRGADVEVRDTSSRTPLMWAAVTGKASLIRILLESKRKPDVEVYVGL